MTIRESDEERKNAWNNFVADNDGFFLQSWEWGELQSGIGRQVSRLRRSDFAAQLISYKLPFEKRYLYVPRGPVISSQKPLPSLKSFLAEFQNDVSKQNIFLRIEPVLEDTAELAQDLKTLGFKRAASSQPETTIILDLKKSETDLEQGMEHDTRYAIRAARKRKIKIINSSEPREKKRWFDKFWPLFEETNKRHHLKAYPKRYYWKTLALNSSCSAEIFAADLNNLIISSAIIVYFGKTAVYLYSASKAGYGRYNAPTLLLWEAVKVAKSRGYQTFDLWGVSHENPRWAGITAFKHSFGGREIRYTGTWDYLFDKKWYSLYNLTKKIIS